MGNQHAQSATATTADRSVDRSERAAGSRRSDRSLSRSASGADLQDGRAPAAHLSSVDKLAKTLVKRSQAEDGVHGVSQGAFQRHVFPRYPVLGERLFQHFAVAAHAKTPHQLSAHAFRQQVERFLAILDDEVIRGAYVRMYAVPDQLDQEALRLLLMTAYRVAMDHYSEGPQMCLHIQRTLGAVVDSCFHGKQQLSAQYVCGWMASHCPRLLLPLHRYAVHCLATAHRKTDDGEPADGAGLDLATPVLEQPPPLERRWPSRLMPLSFSWLLAGALPPLYSRPQSPGVGPAGTFGAGAGAHAFLAKLVAAVPSHWLPLYNSDCDGQGANRFLHHVLAYRGPTLCLLKADGGDVFCLASPSEWHESHLYWGGDDCAVLQMTPKFVLAEQGPKLLYLNTTIRGYPQGLRAGKDPRKPVINVDAGFEKIEFHGIPYGLAAIEVWGCGDQTQRDAQLDVKKWQVKEAERQRTIKLSAADWLDHPDRYLLELAGRPQYHSKHNNQAQ